MTKYFMQNPVFFKETLEQLKGRGFKFLILLNLIIYPLIFIIPFCAVTLITLSADSLNGLLVNIMDILKGCFYFSTGIQFFYILFSSLNNNQFSLTREKEQRTFDSLVISLMKPQEILWGKLIAGSYPVLLTLVIYSPIFFLAGIISGLDVWGLFFVFLFSLIFCIFCSVIGLFSSAISSTSGKAQNIAASITAILIVGTFFVDFFVNMIFRSILGNLDSPLPLSTLLNPALGYISAASCYDPDRSFEWFCFFWIIQLSFILLMTIAFWYHSVKKVGEIPRS